MFKEKVKVLNRKEICDGVIELEMTKPEGFTFRVGQYVNLYIPEKEVVHGKSYTIVSTNKDKNLKFSIRKRGPFSTCLHNLKVGDEMILEGPEGVFHFEDYEDGLIFIGAGIGIAPLVNYMKFLQYEGKTDRELKVLFTNKTKFSSPYEDMLNDKKTFPNIHAKFFYTEEGDERISMDDVKKVVHGNDLPIFICGSINFVNDFWKGCRELGIDEERIFTEAFF
jgi:nitric oxide dioxygenase